MGVYIRHMCRRGQTSIEYLLLLAVVAVVVIASFGPHSLVQNVHDSAGDYYNSVTRAIMGENPKPIDGGWCPVTCRSQGNYTVYRACECPAPAFGGKYCPYSGEYECRDGTGCIPKTCAQLGANCGSIADGCPGDPALNCGNTPPNQYDTCGGGGVPNVWGCTPNCDAASSVCVGVPFADSCGNANACTGTKAGTCDASTAANTCSGTAFNDSCGNPTCTGTKQPVNAVCNSWGSCNATACGAAGAIPCLSETAAQCGGSAVSPKSCTGNTPVDGVCTNWSTSCNCSTGQLTCLSSTSPQCGGNNAPSTQPCGCQSGQVCYNSQCCSPQWTITNKDFSQCGGCGGGTVTVSWDDGCGDTTTSQAACPTWQRSDSPGSGTNLNSCHDSGGACYMYQWCSSWCGGGVGNYCWNDCRNGASGRGMNPYWVCQWNAPSSP